jgi:hypothetical protein
VSIAAAVTVMAAQPTREAPPTKAILFPFLLISIPLFVLRAGGRFGSFADIEICVTNVCFALKSRHFPTRLLCPLCAINGHGEHHVSF